MADFNLRLILEQIFLALFQLLILFNNRIVPGRLWNGGGCLRPGLRCGTRLVYYGAHLSEPVVFYLLPGGATQNGMV